MKTDIETLKAWCVWRRKHFSCLEIYGYAGEEVELVKSVEDLISQVGTFKAELSRARAEVNQGAVESGQLRVLLGYAYQEARSLLAPDAHELFVAAMDKHRAEIT